MKKSAFISLFAMAFIGFIGCTSDEIDETVKDARVNEVIRQTQDLLDDYNIRGTIDRAKLREQIESVDMEEVEDFIRALSEIRGQYALDSVEREGRIFYVQGEKKTSRKRKLSMSNEYSSASQTWEDSSIEYHDKYTFRCNVVVEVSYNIWNERKATATMTIQETTHTSFSGGRSCDCEDDGILKFDAGFQVSSSWMHVNARCKGRVENNKCYATWMFS